MALRPNPQLVQMIEAYLHSSAHGSLSQHSLLPVEVFLNRRRGPISLLTPISRDLATMGLRLREMGRPLMAVFRRGGKRAGAPVRLPIFPDQSGEDDLLAILERSGIRIIEASRPDFIHQAAVRAAEFATLADRSHTGTTTVHTPSDNETVVFCKGYFLSTVAGFGQSTPAKNRIPAGQYCFGVMRQGAPRIQDLLWDCPTDLHLDMP